MLIYVMTGMLLARPFGMVCTFDGIFFCLLWSAEFPLNCYSEVIFVLFVCH